jgi:ComF family protein
MRQGSRRAPLVERHHARAGLQEHGVETLGCHRATIVPMLAPTRTLPPAERVAWPTQCAVCRAWGRARLCADCTARHAQARQRCTGCGLVVPAGVARCGACIAEAPPFAACVAALDYAFPWSGLVGALKFRGQTGLAAPLGARLAERVRAAGRDAAVALVLPLPLGADRLAERGFNQSALLARRVARALALPIDTHALQRVVETPHLADLPPPERARAIRGAFAVAPGARRRIEGRALALVDDVMTTGATAAEAARTLLAAGAASVELWVVARTPPPTDA